MRTAYALAVGAVVGACLATVALESYAVARMQAVYGADALYNGRPV